MKYSIVIPTYNHCTDLLKPCIDTIFKYTNMGDVELIISANGCIDNTKLYLDTLRLQFDSLGFSKNLKIVWNDAPLGYSKATNEGIKVSTTDKIVLLNNDTLLLEQSASSWLSLLESPFLENDKCGISCVIKSFSEPAGHDFAIFFCVMVDRKVFDTIGLLNEEYGKGGGEDTEFSIEAEKSGFDVCVCTDLKWNTDIKMYTGSFPIYHIGEGTVHDATLVPDWSDVFFANSVKLSKKYNPSWYINKLKELDIQDIGKKLDWIQYKNEEAAELYKEIITDNTYEILPEYIKDKTVIDIGANIGVFSLYAASLGAKTVYSVEPVKETFDQLVDHIKLCNFTDVIKPIKNVVSDIKNNTVKISINPKSGHNNIYTVSDSFEEVRTITLSDILSDTGDYDIFLKLDCEGAEYDILSSVSSEDMKKVSTIAIEIHSELHPTIKGYEFIHNKLKEFGFNPLYQKQIGAWDYDSTGNLINYREIPLRIETWSR